MPRVLVFGTFDLLHPGHIFALNKAAKRGERHIAIARDMNVEKTKGRLPEQNEDERLQSVQKAFPDSHVQLGDEEDFLAPVRKIQPDLILLGYDQKLPRGIVEADLHCPIERLPAFEPEKWKSSIQRKE